jgi:hypothetical protein
MKGKWFSNKLVTGLAAAALLAGGSAWAQHGVVVGTDGAAPGGTAFPHVDILADAGDNLTAFQWDLYIDDASDLDTVTPQYRNAFDGGNFTDCPPPPAAGFISPTRDVVCGQVAPEAGDSPNSLRIRWTVNSTDLGAITDLEVGRLVAVISGAAAAPQTLPVEVVNNVTGGGSATLDQDGAIEIQDVTAVLNVQPPALNFGGVPTGGTSAPQTVTVSNDGTDGVDLEITSIGVTGDFDNAGGTCTVGTNLADGATCTIDITFSPTADGAAAGTLTVGSDAGDVTNDTVSLDGEGMPTDAALTIDPAAFDFGDQDIGDGPVCTDFTLGNTPGTDSLTIGTVTVAAPFTVTGNCNGATLGGGESCVVEACFDPDAEGPFAEMLNATSDAGDVSASLEGNGTAEADVSFTPPFGPVSLGTGSAGDTLMVNGSVTNSGSADATVECTLDDMTGVFSTDPSPLAGPLAAGATIDFTLSCALPVDAEQGATYEADLNCSVDGAPAGTHNLSCGVMTFQAIPVPTMQNWALALFALMMLLIGGISIRFFRAS